MTPERKGTMLSARVPKALVDRVDFVVRNNNTGLKSRSAAIQSALEDWLPGHEFEVRKQLGTSAPKKAGS